MDCIICARAIGDGKCVALTSLVSPGEDCSFYTNSPKEVVRSYIEAIDYCDYQGNDIAASTMRQELEAYMERRERLFDNEFEKV